VKFSSPCLHGLVADIHPDGLTRVFATVKTTPNVRDLPENYQAVLEWARVSYVVVVPSRTKTLTAEQSGIDGLSELRCVG
jgi:hypothetical protein